MESLLRVEPGLLLWTIISFVILLLILWKTAWRPIIDVLDSRAEKVRSDIENAEYNRIESEKLLSEHKELIDQAKSESEKIIAEGKSFAEKMKNDILKDAKEEANEVLEKAKREIEIARENAFSEIKEEIIDISTEIASKIIAKSLDPKDQERLVKSNLARLRINM